jgi:NAD(P)-dependent dehydrogenase (short-subunit alcohol dehydrogenase family)
MSDRLHGQKAVVVDGSSGIGLAAAEALLAAGADVGSPGDPPAARRRARAHAR